MKRLGVALVVGLLSTQAQAHHHSQTHHHFRHVPHARHSRHRLPHAALTRPAVFLGRLAAGHFSSDARPVAWCGWYMRHLMGVTDAAYNLARNWTRFGRDAHGPGVGVVVVFPHHVGLIVGHGRGGLWVVKSGNDGHAIRERERSLAGAIAFRSPT